MNFGTSQYIIISSEGYDAAECSAFNIVFSTRTCELFWLTPDYIAMLVSGDLAGLPEDVFKALLFAEIIIPAAEQELDLVIKRSRAAVADDKTLKYAIKYGTDDIEKATTEIGCLLSEKNYKKLLLEWQEEWPAGDCLAVAEFTHNLKMLAQRHSCVYEAELRTNFSGDATEYILKHAADYDITGVSLILEYSDEAAFSEQTAAICKNVCVTGHTPAIQLILNAGNHVIKAIAACHSTRQKLHRQYN